MKLFLILVLCGVSSCFAFPNCSKEDIRNCSEKFEDDHSEHIFKGYCRVISCWLDKFKTCGDSQFGPYFPHKDFEKMLNTLCVKGNPMQKKYYENIKCISTSLQNDTGYPRCIINKGTQEETCKRLPETIKCLADYNAEVCGKDAGEVYQVAVAPILVSLFSGCVPLFQFEIGGL